MQGSRHQVMAELGFSYIMTHQSVQSISFTAYQCSLYHQLAVCVCLRIKNNTTVDNGFVLLAEWNEEALAIESNL